MNEKTNVPASEVVRIAESLLLRAQGMRSQAADLMAQAVKAQAEAETVAVTNLGEAHGRAAYMLACLTMGIPLETPPAPNTPTITVAPPLPVEPSPVELAVVPQAEVEHPVTVAQAVEIAPSQSAPPVVHPRQTAEMRPVETSPASETKTPSISVSVLMTPASEDESDGDDETAARGAPLAADPSRLVLYDVEIKRSKLAEANEVVAQAVNAAAQNKKSNPYSGDRGRNAWRNLLFIAALAHHAGSAKTQRVESDDLIAVPHFTATVVAEVAEPVSAQAAVSGQDIPNAAAVVAPRAVAEAPAPAEEVVGEAVSPVTEGGREADGETDDDGVPFDASAAQASTSHFDDIGDIDVFAPTEEDENTDAHLDGYGFDGETIGVEGPVADETDYSEVVEAEFVAEQDEVSAGEQAVIDQPAPRPSAASALPSRAVAFTQSPPVAVGPTFVPPAVREATTRAAEPRKEDASPLPAIEAASKPVEAPAQAKSPVPPFVRSGSPSFAPSAQQPIDESLLHVSRPVVGRRVAFGQASPMPDTLPELPRVENEQQGAPVTPVRPPPLFNRPQFLTRK
jgi:hypothetical protein